MAAGDHVLALSLHHIVADGWSMGVLVRELVALYPARLEDRPSQPAAAHRPLRRLRRLAAGMAARGDPGGPSGLVAAPTGRRPSSNCPPTGPGPPPEAEARSRSPSTPT